MFVLGLTGSIGMGKSEAARAFRRLGVPIYDADAAVHRLFAKGGGAVAAIERAFPGAVKAGAVDRVALGALVFGKPSELRRLEAIVHPLVGRMQRRFLASMAHRRQPMVVLDVPLLFETNGERRTDATVAVSAPGFVQAARVLRRPNMTADRLARILRQQMADGLKRQRADFVVQTGLGKRHSLAGIQRIMRRLRGRAGGVWPARGRPRPRPSRHPLRRPLHARNRARH
ncbi:MAG: dephospho-CoA kinase [Alphaproteobacteria bacterium]|nr:dephospho-CoA kinase [Alphaproteobacteria bacterium]